MKSILVRTQTQRILLLYVIILQTNLSEATKPIKKRLLVEKLKWKKLTGNCFMSSISYNKRVGWAKLSGNRRKESKSQIESYKFVKQNDTNKQPK